MINVYLDTEFTRLPVRDDWDPDPTAHVQLISIGIIDESGTKTFYAELSDGWQKSDCATFTVDTVLPLLQGGEAIRNTAQLRKDLAEWVKGFDDKLIFYCDYIVDWYFARNLLDGQELDIDYELIQPWALDEEIAQAWMLLIFFDPVTKPKHHALNDAMGLRATYLKLGFK